MDIYSLAVGYLLGCCAAGLVAYLIVKERK